MDQHNYELEQFLLLMIRQGVDPSVVSSIGQTIESGAGNPMSTFSINAYLHGVYSSGNITSDQLSALLTLSQGITGWPSSLFPSIDSLDGLERLYFSLSNQGFSVQQEEALRRVLSTGTEAEVNAAIWDLVNAGYNVGTTGVPGETPDAIVAAFMDLMRAGRPDWGTESEEGTVPEFDIEVTGRSVKIFVNNTSIENYHRYRITTASTTVLDSRVQMTNYTYSQLLPGIEYTVDVAYGKRQDGSDERWLQAKVFYSNPIISSFLVVQKKKGERDVEFSFSASDVSPNATFILVRSNPINPSSPVYLATGALRQGSTEFGTANGSGQFSVPFLGSFYFKLEITNNNGGTAQKVLSSEISERVAPEHFVWTSANYPDESDGATADQTTTAYRALTQQGKLSDFSYKVWNDLCHRVKDTADYAGYEWDESYLNYQNTLMSDTDKVITAVRFNSLNHNIRLRYATGIPYQNKGDKIMGNYFTTMVNALNSWIDIAK